jgi:hypothetical protein
MNAGGNNRRNVSATHGASEDHAEDVFAGLNEAETKMLKQLDGQ